MAAPVVIVGGAAAGLSTAEGLRDHGYEGDIAIIESEPTIGIDRPPLSKQILAGTWPPERAAVLPRPRVDAMRARMILGRRAVELDLAARIVRTDDGAAHPFAALVIATGVRPRTIATAPPTAHLLRTLDDAMRLQRSLRPGARLAVVGAGFLGLEVAATARVLGLDVTVVEPLALPLAGPLGPDAALRLVELHEANGVRLLRGVGVADVSSAAGAFAVALTDGGEVAADVVVVAVGCAPDLEWLASSGLRIDDGIVCDQYCAAAPHVWAAGDVARWYHAGLGRHIRLEHRTNATEQGRAVAQNIVHGPVPFTPVPFFWTDHYDTRIQVAGVVPDGNAGTVEVENAERRTFVRAFREDGRLVGALGWNAVRELMPYRRELEGIA